MSDEIKFGALTIIGEPSTITVEMKSQPVSIKNIFQRNDVSGLGLRVESDGDRGRRWDIGLVLEDDRWHHLTFYREPEPYEVPAMVETWASSLNIRILETPSD